MQDIARDEYGELARLVEVTSDAVALCLQDGTILHVNQQLVALMRSSRERIVGQDIKDLLFSTTFERSTAHRMPFSMDGADNTLMLKYLDGSFVPVRVRAIRLDAQAGAGAQRLADSPRILVALSSLEERYAYDRRTQRLLSELQAANRRLSGTLSVIMSTVGSKDLPALLDTVLNKLCEALDSDGASMYFAESGGFKLRGVSQGLLDDFMPDFVPYGAGISTYVLRAARGCRFSVAPDRTGVASSLFYDLDAKVSHPLRMEDTPPFKTLIAVPVYFGTQLLGIIESGWRRPTTPRVSELRVLEVVCDYLSIELVGIVGSMRSQRTAELTRSLNRLRDSLFALDEGAVEDRGILVDELRSVLSCRICAVTQEPERGVLVIDFEGGNRIDMPGDIESLFFSSRMPASRVGSRSAIDPLLGSGAPAPALRDARMVRVDRSMGVGEWLADHGLPCQGVFVDLGHALEHYASLFGHAVLPAAAEDAMDRGENAGADAGADTARSSVPVCFLLLRDGSQEPIDDMEYDYLLRLIHDFELIEGGARGKKEDRRIAQALQAGMRSSLGAVPGIVSDALYSSATRQALVGGDFYTLIRLPDDRAVMILGDVSGKGVEAASMSALVKTALTAYAWEGMNPAALARSLNSMLMGFSRLETFATMFIAKIDLRTRTALYCSAGHPPTMLYRPSRGEAAAEVELLSVQSGVVGAFEGMVYEGGSFTFEPGDMLFMYTDGAIEARSSSGEFYGEQRLRDLLLRLGPEGVEGLCGKALSELDAFADSALDDDIAMVALRFE